MNVPSRDRSGYYATPRGKFMSVTTILSNGVPKPQLIPWTARMVAERAVQGIPRLSRVRGQQAREEAFEWLRTAADATRDAAASLGSAIHHAVEATVLGTPMPEPDEQHRPFLDAFTQFCADWQPAWEATEMVVAHPEHAWAGTGDWWARIPELGNVMVIGDYKSGKSVWGDAALQMAAYRRATVGWLKDGTEVVPPLAERAVVVHLRPDTHERGYALIPMDTGDAVYDVFRSVQAVASYRLHMAEQLVGTPLDPVAVAEVA